jgi:hypothetical protein
MYFAIQLARDSVKRRHPQFDEFKVNSIDMKRIGWSYKDRWYYVIKFRAYLDGAALLSHAYFAGVLMDGTVIEPEAVPPPVSPVSVQTDQ